MAKDRKKAVKNETTGTEGEANYDGQSELVDDELPPEVAGDDLHDEEEFEFDPALAMKGVELVDLAPDFVRPAGFLMVPRLNKRTGVIYPSETTFAGILNDIVPWKDARNKERVWFSCTATADIQGTMYVGRDDDTKEPFTAPVKKGDRIGISGSGAIHALKSKKGHFVLLHWTGNTKDTKNGPMWEVIAKVSKDPVEKPPF